MVKGVCFLNISLAYTTKTIVTIVIGSFQLRTGRRPELRVTSPFSCRLIHGSALFISLLQAPPTRPWDSATAQVDGEDSKEKDWTLDGKQYKLEGLGMRLGITQFFALLL